MKNVCEKKHGRGGLSLVEVLIASAILGVLAMAVMSMLQSAQKSQKNIQNFVDFDVLKNSIMNVVYRKSVCDSAFYNVANSAKAKFNPTGSVLAADALGTLRMGSSIVAQVGQKLGGGLEISKLELEDTGVPPIVDAASGEKIYDVNLIIEAKKAAGSVGGDTISNKSNPFRVAIITDSSSSIIGCDILSSETSSGTPAPIPSASPTPAVAAGSVGSLAALPALTSTWNREFTHTLGAVPKLAYCVIVCDAASCGAGYVSGDEINAAHLYSGYPSGGHPPLTVYYNATKVGINHYSNLKAHAIGKGTTAHLLITPSVWKLRCYASN